jgi:hypothetical protein
MEYEKEYPALIFEKLFEAFSAVQDRPDPIFS